MKLLALCSLLCAFFLAAVNASAAFGDDEEATYVEEPAPEITPDDSAAVDIDPTYEEQDGLVDLGEIEPSSDFAANTSGGSCQQAVEVDVASACASFDRTQTSIDGRQSTAETFKKLAPKLVDSVLAMLAKNETALQSANASICSATDTTVTLSEAQSACGTVDAMWADLQSAGSLFQCGTFDLTCKTMKSMWESDVVTGRSEYEAARGALRCEAVQAKPACN